MSLSLVLLLRLLVLVLRLLLYRPLLAAEIELSRRLLRPDTELLLLLLLSQTKELREFDNSVLADVDNDDSSDSVAELVIAIVEWVEEEDLLGFCND